MSLFVSLVCVASYEYALLVKSHNPSTQQSCVGLVYPAVEQALPGERKKESLLAG